MDSTTLSHYCDPNAKQSKRFVGGNLYQIKEDVLMLMVDEEVEALHETTRKSVRGPRVTVKTGSIVFCVSAIEIEDRRVPKYTDDRKPPESKQRIAECTFVFESKAYVLYAPSAGIEDLKLNKFTDCIGKLH